MQLTGTSVHSICGLVLLNIGFTRPVLDSTAMKNYQHLLLFVKPQGEVLDLCLIIAVCLETISSLPKKN